MCSCGSRGKATSRTCAPQRAFPSLELGRFRY
jgi:hypothetical protein